MCYWNLVLSPKSSGISIMKIVAVVMVLWFLCNILISSYPRWNLSLSSSLLSLPSSSLISASLILPPSHFSLTYVFLILLSYICFSHLTSISFSLSPILHLSLSSYPLTSISLISPSYICVSLILPLSTFQPNDFASHLHTLHVYTVDSSAVSIETLFSDTFSACVRLLIFTLPANFILLAYGGKYLPSFSSPKWQLWIFLAFF